MATIRDEEFGDITIRRNSLSKGMKLSIAPNGLLRISMPKYAPLFMAKRFIAASRSAIRELYAADTKQSYFNGMQVGKSHSLSIVESSRLAVKRDGQRIIVMLPKHHNVDESSVRTEIHEAILSALRREAKSYLPKRLAFLAQKHGFSYSQVRFSHASSRWGSCSTSGTISLNIALMTLSYEIIDYVLLHELAHTVEMNHSSHFWEIVRSIEPNFKAYRRELRSLSPTIL